MLLFDGAEPVHQHLQLGGHTVIVQRRDEYHHIRVQDLPAELFHIVLLYAWTFVSATDAAGTGMQVGMGGVDNLRRMTGFFGAPDEFLRQQVGGSVPVGAAF